MEVPPFRFLCLHGKGTNSKIFETQTAAFRAWLQEDVEFDFVDGDILTHAAAGVNKIYPGPYRAYFEEPTTKNVEDAYQELLEIIDERGPYDGVIGYSQGGTLAATAILHHSTLHPMEDLFKCAIFIHAGIPFDLSPTASKKNAFKLRDSDGDMRFLIPTVHIVGLQDPLHSYCLMLKSFEDETMSRLVEHPYGHDVPVSRDVSVPVAEAVSWLIKRVKFMS